MIDFVPTSMAHGGEAIGRVDGKAHFVDGALPGELIRGSVTREKKHWARVALEEVLEVSPERVAPPCPHFADCGGCQWQFATHEAQRRFKESIVRSQLEHIGKVVTPPVRPIVSPGAPFGYRNRMDFVVSGGRLALRQRRSRTAVPLDSCLLLTPALEQLFDRIGEVSGARIVTLRASDTTGETLAVITGDLPAEVDSWGCSVLHRTGKRYQTIVGRSWLSETVAGVGLRISADAFFQNNTPGAEMLVTLAAEAVAAMPGEVVLDAYAGGGLFGLTLAGEGVSLLAVESDALAIEDLRFNSEGRGGDVRIFAGRIEDADATTGMRWDVAVVDPPRTGLGTDAVDVIVAGEPRTIGYVSCDPASFARDTALLNASGYVLDWVAPVDMFPQTFHVELVAKFSAR